MRVASIDIGTNTVLLLIAEITDSGEITTVHHEERLPRIGRDVDYSGAIQPSAISRAVSVIREYQGVAKAYNVDCTAAAATSAVRDATNRLEFVEAIKAACGIAVEILSGEDEAILAYRGALIGLHPEKRDIAVIDIGGGSTEVTFPTPGSHNGSPLLTRFSLQMGSVRITERHFKNQPPAEAEVESARRNIADEFAQIRNPGFHRDELFGVAGTVTTLACLDLGLIKFAASKVSGYRLALSHVRGWLTRILGMTREEIRNLSDCTAGRADILPAGVLILTEFMTRFGFSSALVSEKGLRYGLALREWERRSRT